MPKETHSTKTYAFTHEHNIEVFSNNTVSILDKNISFQEQDIFVTLHLLFFLLAYLSFRGACIHSQFLQHFFKSTVPRIFGGRRSSAGSRLLALLLGSCLLSASQHTSLLLWQWSVRLSSQGGSQRI